MNQMETPNLPDLKRQGIGITIFCGSQDCGRMSQYVPIDQALEKFGPVTLRELERKIYCQTCREAGRGDRVSVRQSTLDIDDLRHGRPAGTTERRQAERAIADVAAEEARWLPGDWKVRRRTIPPTPGW